MTGQRYLERDALIVQIGRGITSERHVQVDGDPDLSVRLREIYNPIIVALREAPKPVIGAIQGAAAGLGCSLALEAELQQAHAATTDYAEGVAAFREKRRPDFRGR